MPKMSKVKQAAARARLHSEKRALRVERAMAKSERMWA